MLYGFTPRSAINIGTTPLKKALALESRRNHEDGNVFTTRKSYITTTEQCLLCSQNGFLTISEGEAAHFNSGTYILTLVFRHVGVTKP